MEGPAKKTDEFPYKGAKEILLVNEVDNKEFLQVCLKRCIKNYPL